MGLEWLDMAHKSRSQKLQRALYLATFNKKTIVFTIYLFVLWEKFLFRVRQESWLVHFVITFLNNEMINCRHFALRINPITSNKPNVKWIEIRIHLQCRYVYSIFNIFAFVPTDCDNPLHFYRLKSNCLSTRHPRMYPFSTSQMAAKLYQHDTYNKTKGATILTAKQNERL